ncbi:MAG: hypothetical protein HUU50_20715 [Candidatus Brocadiae bacterium]|nr:hypothetical protein [Candidatus Brocadiia bacterium]
MLKKYCFFALFFCFFLALLLFFVYQPHLGLKNVEEEKIALSLLYTGELAGELEPCGCSGSKLGGMLLRSAWVRELKKEESFLLVDGGYRAPKGDKQDKIKFVVHNEILHSLGYDCQFVSEGESISDKVSSPIFLGWGTLGKVWYKEKIFGKEKKLLFVAIEKERRPATEEIQDVLSKIMPDVVFVMTRGIDQNHRSYFPQGKYFTIFFPVDSQAPFSPIEVAPGVLVISAGNRGRYIGLLNLIFQWGKLPEWKSRIIGLEKKWENDPEVEKLLDRYKDQLQKERLLEFQIKRSSPVGFVGSDNCYECHKEEYNQWKTKTHAKAFETLVKEKHHYDPECVRCHTVGYEYEEGFRTVEETPHLIDVGCEECHGPGASHAINPVPGYGKTNAENACLPCHQKDRSPNFEYKKYREMIKHWKD